jgi:hypothetical protein
METTLYDLPKDMLIKLITTLQDVKNLSDAELKKNTLTCLQESSERKTIKIKEFFLTKTKDENIIDLLKSIKHIFISINSILISRDNLTMAIGIIFSNGLIIKIYPTINEFRCGIYKDNIHVHFFETNKNSVYAEEYENYKLCINTFSKYLKNIFDYLYYTIESENYAAYLE